MDGKVDGQEKRLSNVCKQDTLAKRDGNNKKQR